MYKAKLLSLNDQDEYEVTLEINGIDLICFAVVCPYYVEAGKTYPVELTLYVLDGIVPKEAEEECYKIEKVDEKSFRYLLTGKLIGKRLDLGKLSIEDDEYFEGEYRFDGKFIQLDAHAIKVEFLR